jgi:7-cyano-7-deazaguanine synthase
MLATMSEVPLPQCVVLLSGGIDSAVVLASTQRQWQVSALFVEYGQGPAAAEREASQRLADRFGVEWTSAAVPSIAAPGGGEIAHRNDLLVAIAAALHPHASVALGVHAGTPYPDCSQEWVEGWRAQFELQSLGTRTLIAPLVQFSKGEVLTLAKRLEIPFELTHSCETGSSRCGNCSSCKDRASIDAGA